MWRAERDLLLAAASRTPEYSAAPVGRVYLFGDSIFDHFPWRVFMEGGVAWRNLGVSGLGVGQIVGQLADISPMTEDDVLVLEGGINDLVAASRRNTNEAAAVEQVVAGYESVIATAKRPLGRTVVFGVLPITAGFLLPHAKLFTLKPSYDVVSVNRMVNAVNVRLRHLARRPDVVFCPVAEAVSNGDGELSRDFAAADGLHINSFGYQVLGTVLRGCLDRSLDAPNER